MKICPHRYLREYDISVWVDGNITVKGDIVDFINQYDLDKNCLYSRIHPKRKCIYEEAEACIKMRKDTQGIINAQIERYKNEGYPKNIGMVETGVLLRKHNDPKCMIIDNNWASELLLGSHRDQLSFNYVCWKNKFIPCHLTHEFKIRKNSVFTLSVH